MRRTTIAMLLCASMANMQAQNWNDNGNNSMDPVTNFLGTTDDRPMNIRTEDIRRFRLNHDESYTIGSFATQVKNASLLLSPDVDAFYAAGAPGPYTGLHLAAATNACQQAGYRSNMGNGLTMTGNSDQMYMGQKYTFLNVQDHTSGERYDRSGAVVQWSDNSENQPWGTDRLRFLFTTRRNAAFSYGTPSEEGMESFRVFVPNDTTANVGIGDFYRAGLIQGSM